MLRNKISQIISASLSAGKAVVNRPLSAKTPENVDWVKTGKSSRKQKRSLAKEKSKEQAEKKPPCEEPKSAADEILKKVSPCEEKKLPCNEKKSPCDELNKKSLGITRSNPKIPQKKKSATKINAASKNPPQNPSSQNCFHHKNFIPPGDVLSQLKNFELRSDCSSFHLKTSGHEQ